MTMSNLATCFGPNLLRSYVSNAYSHSILFSSQEEDQQSEQQTHGFGPDQPQDLLAMFANASAVNEIVTILIEYEHLLRIPPDLEMPYSNIVCIHYFSIHIAGNMG